MKVALFIPCYVDAFFPEVGIATLELLERRTYEEITTGSAIRGRRAAASPSHPS